MPKEGFMENTAAHWDAVAQNYQNVYRLGQNDYNKSLFSFWIQQGMLRPGDRVLDIGCGVGKYGVMFAGYGCDVTLTDISPEMIARARENLAPYSVPHRAEVSDFSAATGEEPVYAPGFDFSISTMSPAVSTVETVRRMSSMTRGTCFLTNFCVWEQPARDAVMRSLALPTQPLMHGLAADCDALTAAVREAGYTPQQLIVDYCWADDRTPTEQVQYLKSRYADALAGVSEPELLKAVTALCSENGLFHDNINTKVLWLWWSTQI